MTSPTVIEPAFSTLPSSAAPDHPSGVAAIEVDHVSKVYPRGWLRRGASRPALSDVSFRIETGELVGLLGPNGAGKTTLLKSIATMLTVSAGRILLHGCDTRDDPARARAMLGLVTSDERSFYWRLTGRQNLQFFAALYRVPRHEAAARITTLLEVLGLTDAADRSFYGYSSGMKQKMAIARGLLARPRIVLYDEPTRALDPLSAQNIRRWIVDNRSAHGVTTHLIATNQLNEAEQLCDRVLIINGGRLIAFDRIDRIRQQRSTTEMHLVTCAGLPARAIETVPEAGLLHVDVAEETDTTVTLRLTVAPGSQGLSTALATILRRGGRVVRCESHEPSFDEIFCSLVARGSEGGHA